MASILGVNVAVSTYAETAKKCIAWAEASESRAIMFANVHVIMEARDSAEFRVALNRADIVNPDGVPLVWALRALGERQATRVYGPDATEVLLGAAADAGVSVGFLGGTPATLRRLLEKVSNRYKRLEIAFAMSPPFHSLSPAEDAEMVERIACSGAQLLFVGLGCPKQERWIMEHRGRIPAVMLGVGAAFDFLAGSKPQAPRWMMRSGLEWAFRLGSEPRRLARRYMKHNPRFVALFFNQWVKTGLPDRL